MIALLCSYFQLWQISFGITFRNLNLLFIGGILILFGEITFSSSNYFIFFIQTVGFQLLLICFWIIFFIRKLFVCSLAKFYILHFRGPLGTRENTPYQSTTTSDYVTKNSLFYE